MDGRQWRFRTRCRVGHCAHRITVVAQTGERILHGSIHDVVHGSKAHLADRGAKHILLKQGIGWGNMPRHQVAEDLREGTLVELDLPEKPGAH